MKRLLTIFALLLAGMTLADDVSLPPSERIVLDNGAVILLIEKHDVPLIGMEVAVRGGAASDPADKHGLANLLAELMEKGAGDLSSAEFAEAAASVGGEIRTGASLESLNISAEFMSRDASLMVQLVSDMLQRPALLSAEFEKLKTRSINMIKAAKGSDPGELMPDYASAFLFAEHPYGNPVGGSESSLQNIRHGDVRAYYADQVGADRLVIAVAGDFVAADMRALLTAAFEDWRKAAGALPTITVPPPVVGNQVFLIDKPGATQSYFYIGNVGVSQSYAGRPSLDLANTVFGGRFTSMLNTELRTNSGLTYGARSSLSRYSTSGSAFIRSYTATSTTVEAIDLALTTFNRFRDNGLSEEMITSAQNYVMGQFPPRFETASQLAGVFAELEVQGLSASYITEYGSALSAATAESIKQAIDDVYASPENLVFIVLGDADVIREQIAKYGPISEIDLSEPRFRPAP